MIYYMNITLEKPSHFWRPVPEYFVPADAKSDKLWFKIGETVYLEWSEEFEAAVMWDKLKA